MFDSAYLYKMGLCKSKTKMRMSINVALQSYIFGCFCMHDLVCIWYIYVCMIVSLDIHLYTAVKIMMIMIISCKPKSDGGGVSKLNQIKQKALTFHERKQFSLSLYIYISLSLSLSPI